MKPNKKDLIDINDTAKLLHESALNEKTISNILHTIYYMGANAGIDQASEMITQERAINR